MGKFLLILLLLGTFSLVFFQAQALVCGVCSSFKRGHCLVGKGNCTVKGHHECSTKIVFLFSEQAGWFHNHTELGCSDYCMSGSMFFGDLKSSTLCCKGQDFCNKYQSKIY